MGSAPWAILDFPGPDGQPAREIYRDPVAVVATSAAGRVRATLGEVERLSAAGHHLIGFVAYDAAPAFEPRFEVRRGYDGPLVWFAAFRGPTGESLQRGPTDGGPETWEPPANADAYRAAIAEIIEGIGRGDFYQVNFTERFRSAVSDPLGLYERLRLAQGKGYFAFIDTGETQVASVSPELFVRRSGRTLESRPMKGTAARGRWFAEDEALARGLAASEKERAENVMIVDLIRNDMGRIAIPGTVEVPSMFTVERFPTVLQMTSHVKSEVPADTTLEDVFTALFPCGSVTGAPKIAASKSIAALESEPRGVYCGAVGVVRPGGDFTFNVAIRTAVVGADGRAIYGAGGGITADSDPQRELDELFTKAAVLTAAPERFGLIETMRLEDGIIHRLERHLARLESSAQYFGFQDQAAAVRRIRDELLSQAAERPGGIQRVRVLLGRDGSHEIVVEPFAPAVAPRCLALSAEPVDSRDRLLYHKVSDRSRYSSRLGGLQEADDVLLVNERGELTETTIGNIVLELDGRRVSPPLESGLLPGVYRGELLAAGEIEERLLYPADLARCTALWMINSLRGWVECRMA
ncbi:MAG TPA: aminodeoxychorismate synthase component I [Gemmatimonadaceae bacterium]|nr:aminodeoxychorismate synthase component I [Gemmatimonadaceae bacterium]